MDRSDQDASATAELTPPPTAHAKTTATTLAMGGLTGSRPQDLPASAPESPPVPPATEQAPEAQAHPASPVDAEAPPASTTAATPTAPAPPPETSTAPSSGAYPGSASQLEPWLRRAPVSLRISPSEQWTLVLWRPGRPFTRTPRSPSLSLAYALQGHQATEPDSVTTPTLHVTMTAWRDAASAQTALQRAVGPRHAEAAEPCPGADQVLADPERTVVSARMGDLLAVYHLRGPGQDSATLAELAKAHVAAMTKERP